MTGFWSSPEMKMWWKPNEPGEALRYFLSAISRQALLVFRKNPEES
jgi:hypothetical protein